MSDLFDQLKNGADTVNATGAAFVTLTGIFIGLRMVSRPLLKIKLGVEDWLLLAATIFYWAEIALNFVAIVRGRAALSPMDPKLIEFGKFLYFSGWFYFPAAFCVNLSIIFLYRRLFTTAEFRRVSLAVIILNICWAIPGLLCQILMCVPIHALWNPTIKSTCISYSAFYLAMAIIETLIDIVIFILPLREVSKLHLNPKKKVLISLVFTLGVFSIVTGTLRAALAYKGTGTTGVDLVQDAIWVNVHIATAIICACLPTLRPLFIKGADRFNVVRQKYGYSSSKSNGYSDKQGASASGSSQKYWNRLEHSGDKVHLTEVSAWPASTEQYKNEGVQVKHTVEVIA